MSGDGTLRDPGDANASTEKPGKVTAEGGGGEEAPSGGTPEPDYELEWRRRRRARLSYRAADRAMMTDGVLILMALIVALFMVHTRGCQSSLDGLSKVLTGDVVPPEAEDARPPEDGDARNPR